MLYLPQHTPEVLHPYFTIGFTDMNTDPAVYKWPAGPRVCSLEHWDSMDKYY